MTEVMTEVVKPMHTFCFYMKNGEHIMVDADEIVVGDDSVDIYKKIDDELTLFMQVYPKDLMAWEVER